MIAQPTIIIVDDDPGIRESLEGLLRSVWLQVKASASVPEFVNEGRPEGPACLVLDVRLPGRSGLDFQRELSAANIHVPIIFITGYGDIPMSVQAIKGGAIEFRPNRSAIKTCSTRFSWASREIARGWITKKH